MNKTQNFTRLTLMIALLVVLGLTPLGFIDIPPVSITTMHIPVIVGSIVLGYKYGSLLGFSFGAFSLIRGILKPSPYVTYFNLATTTNPLGTIIMCIVPRILLGILPGLLFILSKKLHIPQRLAIGITAGLSTVFHTFSVLFCMMSFFGGTNIAKIFATIVGVNGVLEVFAAIIVSVAVCTPLIKMFAKKGNNA